MKPITLNLSSHFCVLPLLLCFWVMQLNGQDNPSAVDRTMDSISTPEVIPYNQILIAAGESRMRTIRIAESLLPLSVIASENSRNDSILQLIDSALVNTKSFNYKSQNQRYLQNELFYWNSAKKHVDGQKSRISGLIMTLQDQQEKIEKEYWQWKFTKDFRDTTMASGSIRSLIDSTLGNLSNLENEIERRSSMLITPLNRTIATALEVELLTERIQEALLEKTSLGFKRSATGIFKRTIVETEDSPGRTGIQNTIRSEWNALLFYFNQQRNKTILFGVFTVFIFFLFIWMRIRLKNVDRSELSYYESNLIGILRRPISCALLFSLFISVAFFPERPPLFRDLVILFLIFPVIDIGMKLIPRSSRILLWGFAGLLLIVLFIKPLPVDSPFYSFIILGLLITELLVLIRLYRKPEILQLNSRTLTRFIRFLIILHLIIVSIGLISVLLGYRQVAKITMESFVNNTLLGFLLYISAIILVGGLQFLVSSSYLDGLKVIREHQTYLKTFISKIVIIGITLFWIDAILRIFYLKNTVYPFIWAVFTRQISIGSLSFSLGKICLFLGIIWLSIIISRVIKVVLRSDVLDKFSLKKGVPRMITAIIQFSLISFGFLLAIRSIGMPLDQLTIIFSAFSVGIGFGLQNIFNNLVSGVILLFEREVQIGDIIEVNNLMGKVQSMGIRSSHIRTFEGAEVIVPNGLLISQEVVDWTLSDKSRRIEILSGVAYGSDVHLVKNLLLQVINDHPDVKKDPDPQVLFNEMGESSLDFRLLFWTDQFDQWLRIRSEVIFGIHDILYENNITIPFPQRDLHIKSAIPGVLPPDSAK